MQYFTDGLTEFLKSIGNNLPGVLGAILVLFIGWLVALGLKRLTKYLLTKANVEGLIDKGQKTSFSLVRIIAQLVYYLVMLFVLLIVLEMLGVSYVLDPLRDMLSEFYNYIPNVVAALLIGFVGYIIAKLISELVGIGGSTLDTLYDRFGFNRENKIFDVSNILKRIVFIIIFIPVLIAAFDVLQIDAISDPATDMLGTFMDAIPSIFAAALIIFVFYLGGRFVTALLRDVLESMGADNLVDQLNLKSVIGNQNISVILSNIAFFFIMFFGIITGVEKLEFTELTDILKSILDLSGKILFGLLIFVIGNFLSVLAYRTLSKGENNSFIANIARFAIIGLFVGIGLNQMGIADNIVNMAFGLTLGAIAVAIALAFGLGGREAAGKQMEHILKKIRGEK